MWPENGEITVRKCKYDGTVKSEWQGTLVQARADEWIVVLHDPDRHLKFSDSSVEHAELTFLHCLHQSQPLTILMAYEDRDFVEAKCDAALPAKMEDDAIEFVDLDLDIIADADLNIRLRDEAEFAARRQRMGYSDEAVEQAFAGIALAQRLIRERRFPFSADFVPLLLRYICDE